MNSSLEKLANFMELNDFQIMKLNFPDDDKLKLLIRKGIFPYDYINSWERFDETILPSKECFFSILKNEHILEEDYTHAQIVWKEFNIKNLGEYTDLYLKTDTILLADIFENFRRICLESYDLDPVHYYTIPGYAWDCCLKKSNIKLELLTDIDMVLFFEKAIRGGICQCSKRYSSANNPYMKNFDSTKPEQYLMYFDAGNLYGWAMTQKLPHSNFTWLTEDEIDQFNLNNILEDESFGYVLEVDLHYPARLHNIQKHKDLPLCAEKMVPPASGSKLKKLLTTLYDKKKYVIHYKNLIQVLSLGLELQKIHRVIKFEQSHWLKNYIDFNTEMRKKSKSDFEKNFYKLMNCAVFGKSMENIRHRRDIKLASMWTGRYGARRLIAKSNFKKLKIFNENLISVELLKTNIIFNKPIYVGMCILEISKHLMYDYHYNYFTEKFQKITLLYQDTDSLIYEIQNQNPYLLIKNDIAHFDTSDYPIDNPYGIPQANKKKIGVFKDENAGNIMLEFVGLRAKMYSFSVLDKSYCKAKGIQNATIKTLTIDDYKNCLYDDSDLMKRQRSIISINHKVYSVEQNKLTLSSNDDKRCLLINSFDTLPWGHKSLVLNE